MKFQTTILCAALGLSLGTMAQHHNNHHRGGNGGPHHGGNGGHRNLRGGRGGNGRGRPNRDGDLVKCMVPKTDDGFEAGKIGAFFSADGSDAKIWSKWSSLDQANVLSYSVRLFDDDIVIGGDCSNAVSEYANLGSFEVDESKSRHKYRPDASLIPTDFTSADAEGLIAALVDDELNSIEACCIFALVDRSADDDTVEPNDDD